MCVTVPRGGQGEGRAGELWIGLRQRRWFSVNGTENHQTQFVFILFSSGGGWGGEGKRLRGQKEEKKPQNVFPSLVLFSGYIHYNGQ